MRNNLYASGSLLALAGILAVGPAGAQAQDVPAAQLDSLQAELELLRARLDSLADVVGPGQAEPQVRDHEEEATDALARLRAAARAAAGDAAADTTARAQGTQEFVGRARSLQALNPEITFTGDVYASIETENRGEDNFFPRAFELSLASALDPYTRAKITMTTWDPSGTIEVFPDPAGVYERADAIFLVEEAYLEWVNLPGGIGIKAGRLFQQFGQFNRWHVHALPFTSRALPNLTFLGQEPLAQDGFSVHWLLPTGGTGAYEATVEVTTRRNEKLWAESRGISFLGHFNAFWELSASTDLDLGISAVRGNRLADGLVSRNALYSANAAFYWAPPARSLYRSLTLRAGVMRLDPEEVTGVVGPQPALGIWTLAEFKFARQWIGSGRYDWVENPMNPDETAWIASPALTYWQSEYVRVRAEYDILGNPGKTTGQFTLRITFAMGPHRHETY